MSTPRADRPRQIAATARVVLQLPPTVVARLAQLALFHQLTRAAFCREAIESFVADAVDAGGVIAPAGALPDRATVEVSVALTPETRAAAERVAVRTRVTLTAVVRSALNAAAADSGAEAVFPVMPRDPATARIALPLTPTAAERLTEWARAQRVTRAAVLRRAIEAHVHADAHTRTLRCQVVPVDRAVPPERATQVVSIAVLPATRAALTALAVEQQATHTAVVRTALNVAAVQSGHPPLFADRACGQRWPAADPARRPRGPAARLPWFAGRHEVGLGAAVLVHPEAQTAGGRIGCDA